VLVGFVGTTWRMINM